MSFYEYDIFKATFQTSRKAWVNVVCPQGVWIRVFLLAFESSFSYWNPDTSYKSCSVKYDVNLFFRLNDIISIVSVSFLFFLNFPYSESMEVVGFACFADSFCVWPTLFGRVQRNKMVIIVILRRIFTV